MRLTLSLGPRSAALLARALGRLDTDDAREATELGLTDALGAFLALPAEDKKLDREASTFGTKIEELWQAANVRNEHPLPLASVWSALRNALRPLSAEYAVEPLYGVGSDAGHDAKRDTHVFVYAAAIGQTWESIVTVGIKRGSGLVAEPSRFWPELTMTSAAWKNHSRAIRTWAESAGADRVTTHRKVAERLLELLKDDAFEKKARTKD